MSQINYGSAPEGQAPLGCERVVAIAKKLCGLLDAEAESNADALFAALLLLNAVNGKLLQSELMPAEFADFGIRTGELIAFFTEFYARHWAEANK